MGLVVGALHIVLAVGLLFAVGLLTYIDLRRLGPEAPKWARHYGWGLIAVAVTLAAHDIVHGAHLLLGRSPYKFLDLITTCVALPPLLLWTWLRTRAFYGRSGDMYSRVPCVLSSVFDISVGLYVGALVMTMGLWFKSADDLALVAAPQLVLVGLLWWICSWMWRTQHQRVCATGVLSTSGMCLTMMFLTMGASRSVYAYRVLEGSFPTDWYVSVIDGCGAIAVLAFCLQVAWLRRMAAE